MKFLTNKCVIRQKKKLTHQSGQWDTFYPISSQIVELIIHFCLQVWRVNHYNYVKVDDRLVSTQEIEQETEYDGPSYYRCWEKDLNVKTGGKTYKVIHPWNKVKVKWQIKDWQVHTKIYYRINISLGSTVAKSGFKCKKYKVTKPWKWDHMTYSRLGGSPQDLTTDQIWWV